MKTKTPTPSKNQLIVFQFSPKDKFRIYAHARNCNFKIQLFRKDKYLLGVYIPPKKLEDGNVYLDQTLLKKYLDFVFALKNVGVKFFLKVYNEKYFCDFTF